MRKIAEIRKDIASKVAEIKSLDAANGEAVEKALAELNTLTRELEAANQIEQVEQKIAEERLAGMEKKAQRGFSFSKFVREIAEGELTGLEAEVAEMGAEEYRRLGLSQTGVAIPSAVLRASTGQNYTNAGDGGNLVETMGARYVDVLKEKLVVAQLGATVLTDLVGQVPVITTAQINASWAAEGASASTSKANFAKAVLSPKRNVVQTAVSKDLLRQTSYDVENMLLGMMADAHANLIEAAAIAGTGSGNQPKGILSETGVGSVAMGTNGAAITWGKVVELESKINAENANKGKMAYLTNAKVWASLKTTEMAANSGRFILDPNSATVNGYKADFSNLVPANLTKGSTSSACSAMIFGNFADLYIGEWGGLDIVVDPYTKAGMGEIVLTINAYNDVLVAQPKSFAVIKDIIA